MKENLKMTWVVNLELPATVYSTTLNEISSIGLLQFNLFTIRYDTIVEFHVDSKVECVQLNLARVARNKKSIKKKLKQTQCPLISVHVKIRECSPVCGLEILSINIYDIKCYSDTNQTFTNWRTTN